MTDVDVDVGPARGDFFRHIPHGADPLHRPVDAADGRWQRGRVVEGMYFADEPDTAWAEWYRHLAGTGLPPAHALPRDLWRWRITLDHVALLDTDERLARAGLPALVPGLSQWAACQAVGETLFRAGYKGLLVPAAARHGHRNLVVFRTDTRVAGCEPAPPPDVAAITPPVPRGLRT